MIEEPCQGANKAFSDSTAVPLTGVGPIVGIMMLETRFQRFPGDIGHPESQAYPCLYRTVDTATVARVVTARPLPSALIERFVDAGHELIAEGAALLATSCGFLHGEQQRLADALGVPVVSSALVLLPLVQSLHGSNGPVGVLTFDAHALSTRHLGAAVSHPVVVEGLHPSAYFRRVVSEDLIEADAVRMREDALLAARALARHAPSAVVLECTNLSPWRGDIRDALGGVAVFDIHDAIACCHSALGGDAATPC